MKLRTIDTMCEKIINNRVINSQDFQNLLLYYFSQVKILEKKLIKLNSKNLRIFLLFKYSVKLWTTEFLAKLLERNGWYWHLNEFATYETKFEILSLIFTWLTQFIGDDDVIRQEKIIHVNSKTAKNS
jgi:hypothetical protein